MFAAVIMFLLNENLKMSGKRSLVIIMQFLNDVSRLFLKKKTDCNREINARKDEQG